MKNIFRLLIVLFTFSFSSCNEYEYTEISVKMINNQSNSWVYMWIESLEDKPTYLLQGQSRTFNMVYTFTEDNPRTHMSVLCDDMGKITGKTFLINKDTTQINAVYNSDGSISIQIQD